MAALRVFAWILSLFAVVLIVGFTVRGVGSFLRSDIRAEMGERISASTESGSQIKPDKVNVPDEEREVQIGLNERMDDYDLSITPLEILEDSRCPLYVECISEGTVRVSALVEGSSGKHVRVFRLYEPISIGSREIILVRVMPDPDTSEWVEASEYLFSFRIARERCAETSAW